MLHVAQTKPNFGYEKYCTHSYISQITKLSWDKKCLNITASATLELYSSYRKWNNPPLRSNKHQKNKVYFCSITLYVIQQRNNKYWQASNTRLFYFKPETFGIDYWVTFIRSVCVRIETNPEMILCKLTLLIGFWKRNGITYTWTNNLVKRLYYTYFLCDN